MYHLSCEISSLLRSVNLILFIVFNSLSSSPGSPHPARMTLSQSLSPSFAPQSVFHSTLKAHLFHNVSFQKSHGSLWTAFTKFKLGPNLLCTQASLFYSFFFYIFRLRVLDHTVSSALPLSCDIIRIVPQRSCVAAAPGNHASD